MLLRISLIIAILAGLGAGVVSYLEVSDKIPALAKQRDDEKSAKITEQEAHKATKKELAKTKSELAQTQSDLADTKADRDKQLARADAQTKRADELTDKLAKVTQEREDALNSLAAYKATDLTPDQILKLGKDLKSARQEVAVVSGENMAMSRTITRLKNELAKFTEPDQFVKLPAGLHGKIVVVDPKWDFVVLNIGEDQGLITDGELLVSRQGKLVAKVIVRSVEKDRSIANLVPGWRLSDMVEGDEVSPAHPAT